MRGHAQPDEEPVQPAKLDGCSMAYQLTPLGISVLALLREHPMPALSRLLSGCAN